MSAHIDYPVYLALPSPLPDSIPPGQSPGSGVTFELCQQCWGPVVLGRMDDHLAAIPHREPASPDLT